MHVGVSIPSRRGATEAGVDIRRFFQSPHLIAQVKAISPPNPPPLDEQNKNLHVLIKKPPEVVCTAQVISHERRFQIR